jgi:hypothetical protein
MKTVLMPPGSINRGQIADLTRSKAGATSTLPGKGASDDSHSEQLSKHEWEQVGYQSVYQSGMKPTQMILSLTICN